MHFYMLTKIPSSNYVLSNFVCVSLFVSVGTCASAVTQSLGRMDPQEEQENEMIVLESIFEEDFGTLPVYLPIRLLRHCTQIVTDNSSHKPSLSHYIVSTTQHGLLLYRTHIHGLQRHHPAIPSQQQEED